MAFQQQHPQTAQQSIGGSTAQPGGQFQRGVAQSPQVGQQQFAGATQPAATQGSITPTYDAAVTPAVRSAIEDLKQVHEIAEWCKTRSNRMGIAPEVVELCDDLAELAKTTEDFYDRGSEFSAHLANSFLTVAQPIRQRLAAYGNPEIQDVVAVLDRTLQSLEQVQTQMAMGKSGQQFQAQYQQPGQVFETGAVESGQPAPQEERVSGP